MSDNISHFGQKIVQSIYNPNIVENENDNGSENEIDNENIECSTNNGDDDKVIEVGKSNFKTQELSLLHSLTSMAYKAVNISSYTKNNNSNNSKNKNMNNNDINVNDDNNNNDNDNDNVNHDLNNDNNNYSVNKTNSNSKANLIINNKLPSSLNRNNIGNIGNGNENISGINTQVPHLIPSSGPGSGLSHSLSKHNTPRDFVGNIYLNQIKLDLYSLIIHYKLLNSKYIYIFFSLFYSSFFFKFVLGDVVSGLPMHSAPPSCSQLPLSININSSSSSSTSIAVGGTRNSLSRLNIGMGKSVILTTEITCLLLTVSKLMLYIMRLYLGCCNKIKIN